MSALREVLAIFGVEVDSKALDKVNSQIDQTVNRLKDLGTALAAGAAIRSLYNFVESQVEAAVALSRTSQMLGLTTDELQKFNYMAESTGVSSEAAATGLRFLLKAMGAAEEGQKAAVQEFAQLGVAVQDAHGKVRPLIDVVADVANKLHGMDDQAKRVYFATKLLGRGGTQLLPMFQKGSAGIAAMNAEFLKLGGGFSKEYIAKAEEAHLATTRMELAFRGLGSLIGVEVFQDFTKIIDKVTEWTSATREFIHDTAAVRVALSLLEGAGIIGAVFALGKLAAGIGLTAGTATGFIGVLGELATGVALPLAGFLALYAVIEDLYVFFTGGKSLIGEWMTAMDGKAGKNEFLEGMKRSVEDLSESFGALGKAISEAFGGLTVSGGLGGLVVDTFDTIATAVGQAITLISGFINALAAIPAAIKSGDYESIAGAIQTAVNKAQGLGAAWQARLAGRTQGGGGNTPEGPPEYAHLTQEQTGAAGLPDYAFYPPKPSIPVPGGGVPATPAQVTQTNTITVQVQGGTNPQETGRGVADGINNGIQPSNNQLLDAFTRRMPGGS